MGTLKKFFDKKICFFKKVIHRLLIKRDVYFVVIKRVIHI